MKKLLLGTVGLMALGVTSASAADLAAHPVYKAPPPIVNPLYDWSGFYIGINGGWAQQRDCRSDVTLGIAFGCHDANGGTVGGQIGYRWQVMNGWVFGVEAQGNWANFKGNNVSNIFAPNMNQTQTNSFGLFTGQIGYAWDRALFYVKGGGAVTDNKYSVFSAPGGFVLDSVSSTRWGAVAGVGVEYAFAPNWSLGFEYDHLFMGTRDVNDGFLVTDNIKQDVDLFTARLNYKFGGPVVARY